jgi:hypothetical protein
MNLSQRWTPLEMKTLQEMIEQGLSVDQIFKSGKFPGRTYAAIVKQIERSAPSVVRHKKSFVGHITEAPIVDLESFLKRYVDAFNKLCDLTDYNKADLERFRLIHTYARDYPALLAEHERLKQVEEALVEITRRLEALETQATSLRQ